MLTSEQKNRPQEMDSESDFMSTIYVQELSSYLLAYNLLILFGDPSGIRTRVTGVRGRRPKPLDDGTMKNRHLL